MSEFEPTIIPGKSIVIEGNDGTGKTTQANMLAWQLRRNNIEVIRVDEPDSAIDADGNVLVPLARDLRLAIKDGSYRHTPLLDVSMFNSSRYQNWIHASKPGLLRGAWRVQARDNTSTDVYQGHAEGLGINFVNDITRQTIDDDLYFEQDFKTILLFKDEIERLERVKNRAVLEVPDTFEMRGQNFQDRLNEGYPLVAEMQGIDVTYITKEQTPVEIADVLWAKMVGKIGINLIKFDWADYEKFSSSPSSS